MFDANSVYYLPDDIVYTDDAVRPGGSVVVHNGSIGLHPDPAFWFGQEPIVLGGDLSLAEHCETRCQMFKLTNEALTFHACTYRSDVPVACCPYHCHGCSDIVSSRSDPEARSRSDWPPCEYIVLLLVSNTDDLSV